MRNTRSLWTAAPIGAMVAVTARARRHTLQRRIISLTPTVLVVGVFIFSPQIGAQDFQKTPITLKASDVLPSNLLTGPNYKVKDIVRNDGLINIYELETNYGPLVMESTSLLLIRINELVALQKMEQLKGTDVYTEALKKSATGPLKTAEGLITDPGGTVKGVATGVGRWFTDVGRSITSDDPHQAGALKTAVGHAPAKRQFAFQFGVDPYSSYEPLQNSLDEIAWTAVGGGLTMKAAFSAIPDAAGTVVSMAGGAHGMKSLVRDKSPAELENINATQLKEMGVPQTQAEAFLKNPHINPQEKTLLVGELSSMTNVKNRRIFIRTASLANNESVATFLRVRAQLLAQYEAKTKSVARFVEANGVPFLLTRSGAVVGIFPFDHLAWTEPLARKEIAISDALKKLPEAKSKELWITGTVDPVAREAFESRGWKVEDRVREKLLGKSS
jgi:hypothetical protein